MLSAAHTSDSLPLLCTLVSGVHCGVSFNPHPPELKARRNTKAFILSPLPHLEHSQPYCTVFVDLPIEVMQTHRMPGRHVGKQCVLISYKYNIDGAKHVWCGPSVCTMCTVCIPITEQSTCL